MAVVREGISYLTKEEHLSRLRHPSLVVNPTEKMKAMTIDGLFHQEEHRSLEKNQRKV